MTNTKQFLLYNPFYVFFNLFIWPNSKSKGPSLWLSDNVTPIIFIISFFNFFIALVLWYYLESTPFSI